MTGPIDRRQMIFGSLLLGGAGVAVAAQPRSELVALTQRQFDDAIPAQIGPYRAVRTEGIVLPPPDELSQRIYDIYLARGYTAAGLPPVTMVIAYGGTQDFELQLHRPESCYPASGWAVGPSRGLDIPLPGRRAIPATTLTATRPGRFETILYWTRIGSAYPQGLWDARLAILRGALARRLPDGVLVRLSTPLRDAGKAIDALSDFNADLVRQLDGASRRLLLGTAA